MLLASPEVQALYNRSPGPGPQPVVPTGGTRTGDIKPINPLAKRGAPTGGSPTTPGGRPRPPGDQPVVRPPTDKPGRPTNKPITPIRPDAPRQPTPDPTTPMPNPTPGGDFAKGQVRPQQMPGGRFAPTLESLFGSGFNPYNTGFGPRGGSGTNVGGLPGGNGSVGGGTGYSGGGFGPTAGSASTYDPLGIGLSNYGSVPYDNFGGSSQNVYNMTGVNAATGYDGPARYGIVGGQGGYGVGMVGPEYSGPLFDDASGALKAMRRQNRIAARNETIQATPAAAPTAATPTTETSVNEKGGQPAGSDLGRRFDRINRQLARDPNNQIMQQRQQRVAGRMKGGQPAGAAPQTGAQPEPYQLPTVGAGTGAVGNSLGPVGNGLGTGLANNGAPPPANNGAAPTSYTGAYEAGQFSTPWGDLVQSSTGGGNIYKRNGGSDDELFYYDPNARQDDPVNRNGWKRIGSAADYRAYNNPASFYKDPYQFAQQAGASRAQYTKQGNFLAATPGTGTYK